MSWQYDQKTGVLSRDGKEIARGYSGMGSGKNNPDAQDQHNVGPIPCGSWQMGRSYTSARKGPLTIPLSAVAGTQLFGRFGFLIHGDSRAQPGAASEGCIILSQSARSMLANSDDRVLEVV